MSQSENSIGRHQQMETTSGRNSGVAKYMLKNVTVFQWSNKALAYHFNIRNGALWQAPHRPHAGLSGLCALFKIMATNKEFDAKNANAVVTIKRQIMKRFCWAAADNFIAHKNCLTSVIGISV